MNDVQKFSGSLGLAIMVFKTDLELALENLSAAFERAKQRREAACVKWDAAGATLAKRGGDLLAKAAELRAAMQAMADADRESFDELAAGYAAARKALPDFERHVCGPTPRPRSVDPIAALSSTILNHRRDL